MIIFRNVRTNRVTQGFGANLLPWYKEMGMLGHNGVDWKTQTGEKLYFGCDKHGFVLNTIIDKSGGYGLDVIVVDGGQRFKHRYWHLKSFNVEPGDIVMPGDLLGITDNTGRSTGSHLHYGLKMVDDNNRTLNKDNGYFGAINDSKWFKNVYILDYIKLQKKISLLTTMVALVKRILLLKIELKKQKDKII